MVSNHQSNQHYPVLLREVLKYLAPEKGDKLLDATAGYGGHAEAILNITGQTEGSVLIDRDQNAISQLQKIFPKKSPEIIKGDFSKTSQELLDKGRRFDLILADLGVSSPHLDNANRGFSFQYEGPLDMRMDESVPLTADDIVNTYNKQDLSKIIRDYGEDPKSKRIAHAIVNSRPVQKTTDLALIVERVYRGRINHKTHPATRTFQALRIAVNDELAQIKTALPVWIQLLNPRGRLAVISFQSLEDRIVKQIFLEYGANQYDASLNLLTKKPITGSQDELVFNPRARSAKLRVAVKK
ncbi:MAG: 16S rRNA (cytosine(1402)-N(4))-methyltransferase RsmH [Candidatus Nomurabacteria bacterium]|nr:MAG: 16S rRNA (cytosine(1402)-N(4))-methyltransferase RsmH [Candidatus Nomurabacteria bacterium]